MTQTSNYKAYDVDSRITEIFDQTETQTEDVSLIRELIGENRPLRILEPFCGNGRILIPLAQDGHQIVGIDKSVPMLDSARDKIRKLPGNVRDNITLLQADVLSDEWPQNFDLVVLGGNCFYELATPAEQEKCVRFAQRSLKLNGYLFLDNDHIEGDLPASWYQPGIEVNCFPTGRCSDGTTIIGSRGVMWHDVPKRLVRFRRTVEMITSDGIRTKKEWIEQKHPPSTAEMKAWLLKFGFTIEGLWGNRKKSPYNDESERAVFWAKLVKTT